MAEETRQDRHSVLFVQLVFMYQNVAWQAMGKIKNPVTDRIDRDLENARYAIDMLEMIRDRMSGSLNDQEKRFLNQSIGELQLNFVDEVEKDRAKAKAAPETPSSLKEELPKVVPEESISPSPKEEPDKADSGEGAPSSAGDRVSQKASQAGESKSRSGRTRTAKTGKSRKT